MRLTDQQVEYISTNLELYGLKNEDLKENILDHICTFIEHSKHTDFEEAYQAAIQKFGGYSNINLIEQETKLLLHFQSRKKRILLAVILNRLVSILIVAGSIFKMMHWPHATLLLFLGFTALIIIALPLYLYSKYKDKTIKYL